MEKTIQKSKKTTIKKWLRSIHRDLGFLMIGFCLIYAVSGILLNHMDGKDPAYNTINNSLSFEKDLLPDELTMVWQSQEGLPTLKRIFKDGDTHYRLMLDGGVGLYTVETGILNYEHHTKIQWIYWINKLHYNKVQGWTIMADLFAVSLIFLALSGLFIASRKYGVLGRGKWYLLLGICIPVVYLIVT